MFLLQTSCLVLDEMCVLLHQLLVLTEKVFKNIFHGPWVLEEHLSVTCFSVPKSNKVLDRFITIIIMKVFSSSPLNLDSVLLLLTRN